MNATLWKGVETFLIGLGVVIISAVIQALTNYHPTGSEGTYWGIFGVAVIGGLRALLSWLIIKQNNPTTTISSTTTTTTSTQTPPPTQGVKP